MFNSTVTASPKGAAQAAPSAPSAAPNGEFDLHKLDQPEGVGRAQKVPTSLRAKELEAEYDRVANRTRALRNRVTALAATEGKSKLGDTSKKYGIEVLEEELRLLGELQKHYERQVGEASIEYAELDRIERIIAGDTVPVAKPAAK
jgi:hypothetical protein